MFKKIAILLVVLSVIGGAAYAFNTVMLKGNLDLVLQQRGGPDLGDLDLQAIDTTATATDAATGIPQLYVNKLGAESVEVDWSSGVGIDLGEFTVRGTVDMTISDFSLYMGEPTTSNLSDYFSSITIAQSGAGPTSSADYSTSSNSLTANIPYTFTVSGTPISGVDFSALEGYQMAMTVNRFVTTDGTPYLLISNPGSYFYDNNAGANTGYSYGGYTLTSVATDTDTGADADTTTAILTTTSTGSGDTEIDWSSGSEYTLGKFNVTSTQDITAGSIEASVQDPLDGLTEFFDNVNLKVTDSAGTVETFENFLDDFSNEVTLNANETYSFEILGTPDASASTAFTSSEGQEIRMTLGSITLSDGTTYLQTIDAERDYFSADEYDETYKQHYSNGGYALSTQVPESDACTTTPDQGSDEDGDGLSDADEENIYLTDIAETDTDGDTLSDYEEACTYSTDPTLSDTDGDGINDYWEIQYGTDPLIVGEAEAVVTGALRIGFTETTSGEELSEKLSTSDFHLYSSGDSTTEVEATIEMKTIQNESHFGIVVPEGEYNITISPDGYVSETFGPYTTAENLFLADINIGQIEYGYYVSITGDNDETTVTANSGSITCDSLGDGLYGCAIPVSSDIPTFTVSNSEYADYEADFTSARTSATDPSETAEMILGDASPITGSDWTISLEVLDSMGGSIVGLVDSNFDLGNQTLTKSEEVDGGKYYLYVENPDSYDVNVVVDGYVSNSSPYDSISFDEIGTSDANVATLDFGESIVLTNSAGEYISGATITTGDGDDGGAVTCVDYSAYEGYEETAGYYGCAIPLQDTSTAFTISADGYDDYSGEFTTDRTSNDDPTEVISVTLAETGTDEEASTEEVDTTTDTDGDGLTDYEEENYYGTDPEDTDTDDDGSSDYDEVVAGTDPLVDDSSSDSSDSSDSDTSTDSSSTDTTSSSDTDTTSSTDDTSTSSSSASKEEILADPSYVCSTPLKDILGHWGYQGICRLYKAGIVKGKTNTTFAPNDYITRAEYLKIALGNAGYSAEDAVGLSETMLDVSDSDWYAPWIKIAESKGFLGNGGVNWYPNLPVYRKDAVVIAVRIAKQTLYGFTQSDIKFTDVFASDYFAYAVLIMNNTTVDDLDGTSKPIINGYSDSTFRGNNHMTRAEVTSMIIRAYLAWYN